MRSIKFHTENFKGRTAMVGELTIENEAIPVYEISVWTESELEDMMIRSLDLFYTKYEQEFLDLAQKLRGEIQKAQPFSLAFIFSCINRYYFPKCDKRDNHNPVEGFLQVWVYGPDGGDWLTWMESPAVADKREKDEAFRTTFEKWALAKFLQLVFGDKCLPFALSHYGSEERVFGNGRVSVGKLRAYNYWSKVCGQLTDLPTYSYAKWDEELELFVGYYEKKLTEKELEQLYEDLLEFHS